MPGLHRRRSALSPVTSVRATRVAAYTAEYLPSSSADMEVNRITEDYPREPANGSRRRTSRRQI